MANRQSQSDYQYETKNANKVCVEYEDDRLDQLLLGHPCKGNIRMFDDFIVTICHRNDHFLHQFIKFRLIKNPN